MTSSGLDLIPAGEETFLDATIFIYHFTGASDQCRRLLDRCERGEIRGVTSLTAVAEVSHRLMMIEAVSRSLISPVSVPRPAHRLQRMYGLLTNDSLLAATALERGVGSFASADPDFERVADLTVYRPQDLQ